MLGFIRRRLAAKLTAGYSLAVLGVTLATGFFLTHQLKAQALQQLEGNLVTQARLMAQSLPSPQIQVGDRDVLQSLAKVWAEQSDCRVTLMATDGTVVADSGVPLNELPNVENHAGRPEVQAALAGRVGQFVRTSATVKQALFYVAIPVQSGNTVVGVTRVALPLTHVHELTRTVVKTLLTGLGLAVAGIVLISSLLALRITRPLASIAQAARQLACGVLTTRVPVTTQDEVGELGQTFNTMADQLQAKIQELEASRSQIEGILQSMNEGVIAVSGEGEVLLLNPAARQILGAGPEATSGRLFGEAVRHPDLQDVVRQVLNTGQPQSRELIVYVPSERHVKLHALSCRCAPGGVSGAASASRSHASPGSCALLVLYDTTDLRRLEKIRQEFVANVSHELKTPITAIRGAVETLLDGAARDPDRGQAFLTSISEETARLQRLVDDLLTLGQVESRQATLPKEPIPIEVFLKEQISRLQPLANAHRVTLKLEDAPSGVLLADRNQLVQAVGNLIDNAIKYNHPGGQVAVRALLRDDQCQVEVADTGIGIPPEDLPRIFERFFRVDKARSRETGGTGLGLSIVKHVAEAHGGSVQVESQPGKGSRFTLILPLA